MAGSAVLGDNLVDDLVPTIDELRGDLNFDFGVRQWRAYTVRRTWSGSERGGGTPTDVALEVTPSPRITDAQGRDLDPSGMDEVGSITLREVSLTYTEAELMGAAGGNLAANIEFFWRLDDRWGQGIPSRYYTVKDVPFPDREKDIGWRVSLMRADGLG